MGARSPLDRRASREGRLGPLGDLASSVSSGAFSSPSAIDQRRVSLTSLVLPEKLRVIQFGDLYVALDGSELCGVDREGRPASLSWKRPAGLGGCWYTPHIRWARVPHGEGLARDGAKGSAPQGAGILPYR